MGDRPSVGSIEEIWRRYDAMEARLTAPLSERMLDLAGLRPGMRVLDLATGRGEPAVRAARRVAPDGLVVGIDVSAPMLAMAKQRAARENISNLDVRCGNAESPDELFDSHFHAATVRWGLMYMQSPQLALGNVRRALLPTGVLVAALWAEMERVPYLAMARRLLAKYRPMPLLDPEAPGMFRYGDVGRAVRDFEGAGFTVDTVEELDVTIFEGETPAEALAWLRELGSGLGHLVSAMPEAAQKSWEDDVVAELASNRAAGSIRLGGLTRIVRARPKTPAHSSGTGGMGVAG